ncbi:hypothetical protein [Neptuniibacter sp. QD37_11]|uniref:hypothetical protein n=1 Tax=Neptuniibacter sp. QD37_11 TaxID=3398209 RepID=UPI0039F634DD
MKQSAEIAQNIDTYLRLQHITPEADVFDDTIHSLVERVHEKIPCYDSFICENGFVPALIAREDRSVMAMDLLSSEATKVNNHGFQAQVAFMLKHIGFDEVLGVLAANNIPIDGLSDFRPE